MVSDGQTVMIDIGTSTLQFARHLHGLFQRILVVFTQIASQTMYLDDLFSFYDIEPAILPPPERTPPPPPDPKEKGRWKQVLWSLFSRTPADD